MNIIASEVLATPPYELDGRQFDDLRGLKAHAEENRDEPPDPRELEARLVREGIIPARAEQYARGDPVLTGLGENGNRASEEKAYEKAHPVRVEARDLMLALLDAADKQAAKPSGRRPPRSKSRPSRPE